MTQADRCKLEVEHVKRLYFEEKLPVNEIAEKLDIPRKNIYEWINDHRITRGREKPKEPSVKEQSAVYVPKKVTPDMIKVSDKKCAACRYAPTHRGVSKAGCNYTLMTGINRGCPVGWCNKMERRCKRGKT